MPTLRRALPLVLAAIVLTTACGGGGSKDKNESGDKGDDTTSTSGLLDANGVPVTNPDGSPAGPSGGKNGGKSGGSGAAKGPERTDIPLAGRYTYDYTPDGGSSSEQLMDVRDQGERRGDVRQLIYLGSDESNTATAQLVVWFGTDMYYVEAEQRAQGGNASGLCAWNPGLVDLDLPLEAGKSWSGDSTCSNEGGTRRRKVQAKVTGTEDVVVGGETVKVWVIERTVDTHTEAKGTGVQVETDDKRVTTDRVTVDRHLLVSSKGSLSSSLNRVPRGTAHFTLALRSLKPTPLAN